MNIAGAHPLNLKRNVTIPASIASAAAATMKNATSDPLSGSIGLARTVEATNAVTSMSVNRNVVVFNASLRFVAA